MCSCIISIVVTCFSGGVVNAGGKAVSIETLLDILLVLFDECQTPALRREKRISEFVDFGKEGEKKIHCLCVTQQMVIGLTS